MRRRRRAREATGQPAGRRADSTPAEWDGWRRKTRRWIVGVAAATLASVLAAWFAAVPKVVSDRLSYKPVTPASTLTISVEKKTPSCGQEYVFPKPPGEIDHSNFSTWVQQHGGVEVGETIVVVTIRGRTSQPVVLTGLRLVVTSRKAPMQGTYIGGDCAYSQEPPVKSARYALVNLDHQPPRVSQPSATVIQADLDFWRVSPLLFPYEVTDRSIETLLLIGRTRMCDCTWKAELSWSNGETSGQETIDLHGKPFHTTAVI